jgi:hypothetical protein
VRHGVTSKVLAVLVLAGGLAFASPGAQAAQPGGAKPEPAAPGTAQGENAKPEAGGAKPEETSPAPASAGTADTSLPDSKPVPLGELTKEGFEIRSADFVPADAVTRQSGKVSSDAIVVTLQKSNATAICFYTLKTYVSKKLPTIPACTVHR